MIQPYVNEDNSCNLPYVVNIDEFGNDVIHINNKVIPLNVKKSSLNYQLTIFNNCFDEYNYSAYQIKDNIYIIIKYEEYKNSTEGMFNIIDNGNIINLSSFINDDTNIYSLSFNDKYIVLLKSDLDYLDKQIIEAYDIENKKMIDCDNYNNIEGLMDKVVNKRRCMLDVIVSILTGKIMDNELRIYNFLSFLNSCEVNKDNYQEYIYLSRKYILEQYPELNNFNLNLSIEEINNLTNSFSSNNFTFNPINKIIDNLTYKQDKVKKK